MSVQTVSVLGCYIAKLSQDVYTLQIQSENDGAEIGILAYNNYEKDSSSGVFIGKLSGDVLLGNYSFDSEGMHSNRQLIFKKVGDNLVEGFGDVKTAGDTETLADTSKVIYDPKVTFVKSNDCLENFTAGNGSFSFNYNAFFRAMSGNSTLSKDWELNSKQNGLLLASVYVPQSYMPKTNFSEATLTIGKSADISAIKNCLVDTNGPSVKKEVAMVSGYPFTKYVFGDAGAGNYYETTSYRGIVGGDCYAVEYTVHSTNIGNYDPSQGIKQFDRDKITGDMESVIHSLRLIVASN